MTRNWRYTIKNSNGDIDKGLIYDTELTVSQIAWNFETQGYEVLELSCLASFPFMKFLIPEERKMKVYA